LRARHLHQHHHYLCLHHRSLHSSRCNSKPMIGFAAILLYSFIRLSYCYYDNVLCPHVSSFLCSWGDATHRKNSRPAPVRSRQDAPKRRRPT
jgi:hypothetical protein